MWNPGNTAPKDRAILVRSAACVSVALYEAEWHGWVAHADGHNACDARGDVVVIDAPDLWCEIPSPETNS